MSTGNAAYDRFLASTPAGKREYRTIEIYHPDFSNLLRFVKDFEDQTLILEATAPRNPSSAVLFTAIAMEVGEPSENRDGDPILTINLGAVANEVNDELDLMTDTGRLTPISVIYRKFYEGDLTGPVLVLNLTASNIKFDGFTAVAFVAEDTDFINKRSGELYTIERFPMLSGV